MADIQYHHHPPTAAANRHRLPRRPEPVYPEFIEGPPPTAYPIKTATAAGTATCHMLLVTNKKTTNYP